MSRRTNKGRTGEKGKDQRQGAATRRNRRWEAGPRCFREQAPTPVQQTPNNPIHPNSQLWVHKPSQHVQASLGFPEAHWPGVSHRCTPQFFWVCATSPTTCARAVAAARPTADGNNVSLVVAHARLCEPACCFPFIHGWERSMLQYDRACAKTTGASAAPATTMTAALHWTRRMHARERGRPEVWPRVQRMGIGGAREQHTSGREEERWCSEEG